MEPLTDQNKKLSPNRAIDEAQFDRNTKWKTTECVPKRMLDAAVAKNRNEKKSETTDKENSFHSIASDEMRNTQVSRQNTEIPPNIKIFGQNQRTFSHTHTCTSKNNHVSEIYFTRFHSFWFVSISMKIVNEKWMLPSERNDSLTQLIRSNEIQANCNWLIEERWKHNFLLFRCASFIVRWKPTSQSPQSLSERLVFSVFFPSFVYCLFCCWFTKQLN